MAHTFQPTPGRVMVKPDVDDSTQTKSGIYLPETATKEKPQIGAVVTVGEDEITENGATIKCPVKVGDKVMYAKWGGEDYEYTGDDGKKQTYKFIKFKDIIAVVK